MLSGQKWGADKRMLITVYNYRALVLSKLSFGGEFMGSVPMTSLSALDKVQNQCLRVILGAERTSPIISTELEAVILPLTSIGSNKSLNTY